VTDEPSEIVTFIDNHPPVPKAKKKGEICGFIPKD
jgi:hypothetical protein